MIYLTKKNDDKGRILVNHRLIEKVKAYGNTLVVLTNGNSFIVDETPDEIIEKIIAFERKIHREIDIERG